MAVNNGSVDLPFIIATDLQRADPETRKLIRHHVMLGKNRVKSGTKLRTSSKEDKAKAVSRIANDPIWPSSITRLLCSKFSAISFADDVEPAVIEDLLSFSSIFSKAMFLLDPCITSKTTGMVQAWFVPLLFDAAYLNAVCFTIQTYLDRALRRTRTIEAQRKDRLYYAKTVRILQDRLALNDDSVRFSDSTILTILSLYGHACTTGDYKSADNHSCGLLRLVSMRGVGTFLQNTKLLIEIIRCDLGMAIDRGSEPVLFAHDNIPWPLIVPFNIATARDKRVSTKQARHDFTSITNRLDPELASVWIAMSNFCRLANAATAERGPKMSEETFLHSMGSIMYRLLHQHFDVGSLNEAFRLGLLAFSSPIFLHWNRVELPDRQFTSAFRVALAALETAKPDVGPRELVWLLMVGAMSMSHEPDGLAWVSPKLKMNIEVCGITTWDGVRDMLCSFLWIGLVYDKPGKEVFDSILFSR